MEGRTALLAAVQNGHADVVVALLAHDGTDANRADSDGKTPLHVAVTKERMELLKLLLAD